MYSLCFLFFLSLTIPLISGDDTATALNMTTPDDKPCYTHLESIAHQHCCKQKRFLAGAPSVTWFQANVNCKAYGYKLASITSKEDNENVMKQLKLQGLEGGSAWIGLNDLAKEGQYVYDGKARMNSTYLNWYPGEPNDDNNDEDCCHLNPDGSFNDNNCKANLKYVCEYYQHSRC